MTLLDEIRNRLDELEPSERKYSDDQERDDHGRWTSTGSRSVAARAVDTTGDEDVPASAEDPAAFRARLMALNDSAKKRVADKVNAYRDAYAKHADVENDADEAQSAYDSALINVSKLHQKMMSGEAGSPEIKEARQKLEKLRQARDNAEAARDASAAKLKKLKGERENAATHHLAMLEALADHESKNPTTGGSSDNKPISPAQAKSRAAVEGAAKREKETRQKIGKSGDYEAFVAAKEDHRNALGDYEKLNRKHEQKYGERHIHPDS